MEIIDPNLIANTDSIDGTTVLTICKYRDEAKTEVTKLSDVLSALPSGLIQKDETGMGATFLELKSQRNSIIVEPIKITASSKAHHHNALYIGSETEYHSKKKDINDIRNYLDNEEGGYKKILVVADSLYKVIAALKKEDTENFFLLIDEVDSFQLDSSFRGSMETVIDTYKTFPVEKRAMVTATPLAFSDPDLSKQAVTIFKYDEPTIRDIKLYYSENLKGSAINILQRLLQESGDEKIMVAYNSVAGCLALIEYIINKGLLRKEQIRLLCGSNSKDYAGGYYSELNSDKLPVKLNFLTSAYFTGFDINENFHLLSISDNKSRIHSLSDGKLKQIAGRCRKTLLSETVLYNLSPAKEKNSLTIQQLMEIARVEIQTLECFKSNFMSNDILSLSYEKVRDIIIEKALPEEHKYVRIKNGFPDISFLNIDAYIEGERVRNTLYQEKGELGKALRSEGHKVDEVNMISSIEVESIDSKGGGRNNKVSRIINELKNLEVGKEPAELYKLKNLDSLQIYIIDTFILLSKSIDKNQLLELMEEKAMKGRDNRVLKNFISSAFYFALNPEDHYKREVSHQIQVGEKYSNEELFNKWKDILMNTNMSLKKLKTEVAAVKLSNTHFKLVKWEDNQSRKQLGHKIRDDNPYKLKLIEHLPVVNNQTYMNYIFQKPY